MFCIMSGFVISCSCIPLASDFLLNTPVSYRAGSIEQFVIVIWPWQERAEMLPWLQESFGAAAQQKLAGN